jgi:hypothetical protein
MERLANISRRRHAFEYVSVMLLLLSVCSVYSLPIISEISIIGGERGLAVSFIADSPVSATFSGNATGIVARFSGCVYGLPDFTYSDFPASAPVRSITAREKKGSIIEITFDMKKPVNTQVKSVQKNARWIALLSESPIKSFAWNTAGHASKTPPAQKQTSAAPQTATAAPAAAPKEAPRPATGDPAQESSRAVLQNVRLLERGHIAELAFEFNTVVKSSIKREGTRVTVSIENVSNGIGKKRLDLPGGTAFKSVTLKPGKSSGTVFLDANVVIDTLETESNFNIAFTQGTTVSLFLMHRDKQKASLWTSGQGQALDYQFYDVPSYKTDMQSIKRRAQRDASRKLSPEKTFALKEAPKVRKEPQPQPKQNKRPAVVAMPSTTQQPADKSDLSVPTPPVPQETTTMVVRSNVVNFRSSPSTRSSVIGKLSRGDKVTVVEKTNKWCKVQTENGTGFIYASLLKEPEPEMAPDAAVATAAATESQPAETAAPQKPTPAQEQIRKVATTPPQDPSAKTVDISPQQMLQQTVEKTDAPQTRKRVIRYSATGRDPFEPLVKESISLKGLPLVEDLNLVGVLIDDNDRIALCEDGSNGNHPFAFREHDRVEKGKVLRIYQDKVVFLITEYGISRSYTLHLVDENQGGKKRKGSR